MSDTFIIGGVMFSVEDWVPLTGNFLILIGVAVTLYVALFVGTDSSDIHQAEIPVNIRGRAPSAEKNVLEATPKKSSSEKGSKPNTPRANKPKAAPTPKTVEKVEKTVKPTSRATTPRKRAVKKEEELGQLMSADGRRSRRIMTKSPGKWDE